MHVSKRKGVINDASSLSNLFKSASCNYQVNEVKN